MKTVDQMVKDIIQREGGYVNHPHDRGGPTRFGVTQKTLSGWLGREASMEDVKALTVEAATEIYIRNYFAGPRLDTLPAEIQPQVFDISINSGPRAAVKMVQKVINLAGFGPVDVDGVLGPQSRSIASEAQMSMGGLFNNALMFERIAFYEGLVEADSTQSTFINGWLARAHEFEVEVA